MQGKLRTLRAWKPFYGVSKRKPSAGLRQEGALSDVGGLKSHLGCCVGSRLDSEKETLRSGCSSAGEGWEWLDWGWQRRWEEGD